MSQPTEILEDKTIQPIPDADRHGRAIDLFTIWFGSNIMILTIVTGALATTIFGLDFWTAVVGLVVGNLVGAVFMALHSAQGPQLGVPQMVQTRGQFGSYGSLLVVVVVVVMYIGFFAANLVLGGQALVTIIPGLPVDLAIVLIGTVSVVATIFGYRLIHTYTKVLSVLSGAALVVAFVWIVAVNGVPENFASKGLFTWGGFMGVVSIAALWQIAYAPYVSDYSRYLPRETGPKVAFWSTYLGSVLGATFPMILGAVVGSFLIATTGVADDIVGGLGQVLQPITVAVVGIFSLGVAATNAMNLYCGVLSTLTVGQTLVPGWSPKAGARAATAIILFGVSLVLALMRRDDFLVYYSNFLALLLYVLVPWTAINLVDYYLLRHGNYVVADFFRRDGGIYGRVNAPALVCYALGILIQIPFVITTLYSGAIGAAIQVDVSWLVCLAVISPVYFLMARAHERRNGPLEPAERGAGIPYATTSRGAADA
jgi:NCS1 family nucleobase:cation symporter-1